LLPGAVTIVVAAEEAHRKKTKETSVVGFGLVGQLKRSGELGSDFEWKVVAYVACPFDGKEPEFLGHLHICEV